MPVRDRTMEDLIKAVKENAERLRALEEERFAKKVIDFQKELIAHSIDKSQAYNRVILAGGYAGFFALWAFVRDYMAPWEMLTTGLAMAFSLAVYIAVTVLTTIKMARQQFVMANATDGVEQTQAGITEMQRKLDEQRQSDLLWSQRIFYPSLFLSIVPAVLAAIILLAALVERLAHEAGVIL